MKTIKSFLILLVLSADPANLRIQRPDLVCKASKSREVSLTHLPASRAPWPAKVAGLECGGIEQDDRTELGNALRD